MGRIQEYSALNCAVNPQACRERASALNPVLAPKKVLIIGGGVAGCEAARVLALRGHRPELFEAAGQLGGNLRPASAPDFKEDERKLIQWYRRQLEQLAVPVHLNTPLTPETLPQDFDVYLAATGSTPRKLDLGAGIPVVTAAEVLEGSCTAQGPYVIVGGGLVGCETALMLARRGEQVSIVEGLPRLLGQNGPLCHANAQMLQDLIVFHKIPVYTGSAAAGVDETGLFVTTDGARRHIPAGTVVLSIGYRPESGLYDALLAQGKEAYRLGDARQVANIMYAVWDAYEVARSL